MTSPLLSVSARRATSLDLDGGPLDALRQTEAWERLIRHAVKETEEQVKVLTPTHIDGVLDDVVSEIISALESAVLADMTRFFKR